MPERDPIDQLHGAWQQLDAPPAVRSLQEEDELTQEVVDWLACGWEQVEIPPLPLSLPLPRRGGLSRRRSMSLPRVLLAAAALLIGFLFVLNAFGPEDEGVEPSDLVAEVPIQGPGQVPAQVPVQVPVQVPTPAEGSAAPARSPNAPQLISSTPEQVQILSGSVRLTMLRGASASTEPEDS